VSLFGQLNFYYGVSLQNKLLFELREHLLLGVPTLGMTMQ